MQLPEHRWHADATGGYYTDSEKARQNAICIYEILAGLGWTLNAVCGVLGNMGAESGYNPWRWEGDIIREPDNVTSRGYGLPQFTPSGKYILDPEAQADPDYSPNYLNHTGRPEDGAAQIRFIDKYADYYSTDAFPISYSDFKISTKAPELLAETWLYNYERPADPSATVAYRREEARTWYDYLSQFDPPVPPTPGARRKGLKVWQMCGTSFNITIK